MTGTGALAHLRRRDRALGRIIDIIGPRKPARLGSAQTPFATLLRSIVLPTALRQGGGQHPPPPPRPVSGTPAERPGAARARGLRVALGGPVSLQGPLGTRPRDEGGGTEDSEPAGARRHGRRGDHRAIDRDSRDRALDRGDAADLHPRPTRRASGHGSRNPPRIHGLSGCRRAAGTRRTTRARGNLASLSQRRKLVPVAGERALRACASTRAAGFERSHAARRNGKKYAMALAATASPPAMRNA